METRNNIKISAGEWEAIVSPFYGGNVISLKKGSQDILRPLTSQYDVETDYNRHGMPILFPVNKTANGSFVFRDKKYQLPINNEKDNSCNHGILNYQCFDVIESSNTEVKLSFTSNHDVYPFLCKIDIHYRISSQGLETSYCIYNMSGEDMPYTFGLHTTFAHVRSFTLPIIARLERDEKKLPTGKWLKLTGEELNYNKEALNSGRIMAMFKMGRHEALVNRTIKYSVSDEFDQWTLFNGEQNDYLCIEPQCGSANGLNMSEDYHRILKADEKVSLHVCISETSSDND